MLHCAGSRRSASQPLVGTLSQSAKLGRHAKRQAPELHCATALATVGHIMPQPPQWATLEVVSTSQPLPGTRSQSEKPGVQTNEQRPAAQLAVLLATEQLLLQAPQFKTDRLELTSQPLTALRSQSRKGALQALTWQTLPLQRGVPLGVAQLRPQVPQCGSATLRSISQPLSALPSQSPKFELQAE